jgi:hypothetical protein
MADQGVNGVPMTAMNREDYLSAAIERLAPLLQAAGAALPQVSASCGFPHRGGMAPKHLVLGQHWPGHTTSDPASGSQIYISPLLADGARIMGVLLHELIHAATPGAGHRGAFKHLALAVGLTGKMTATVPGPALTERLRLIAAELGPYPHTPLERHAIAGKKQTTRLRLYECACPVPVKVRVASDDFRARCERCQQRFEPQDALRPVLIIAARAAAVKDGRV